MNRSFLLIKQLDRLENAIGTSYLVRPERTFKFVRTVIIVVIVLMSMKLETFLTEYIKGRVGIFKKYLLAALLNKECCLWYIECCEGTALPSADLKNCQLLRDAKLFFEDTKLSRNGRTAYKIYCLTDEGKRIAQELKEESIVDENELPHEITLS